jgi:hypothetical protein
MQSRNLLLDVDEVLGVNKSSTENEMDNVSLLSGDVYGDVPTPFAKGDSNNDHPPPSTVQFSMHHEQQLPPVIIKHLACQLW